MRPLIEDTLIDPFVQRTLKRFAKLRQFTPEEIVGLMNYDRLKSFIRETPGDIAFMEEVLAAAKKASCKLEVVP